MKFRDMSTEMTEQEIITALYMICPDSLYKRYKREKGYISVWYSLPNDTETDKHHLELLPDNVYIFDNETEQELTDGDAFFRYHQLTVAKGYSYLWKDINIVLNVKNATTNDSESWNDDTSELDNWGEDDIYK